jgi:hypothetical protein
MALRVIPKPDGFGLRDRRSSKSSDASKWTADDALYDAHSQIAADGLPIAAMFVCWTVVNPDGSKREKFRAAGDADGIISCVERAKGSYMRWDR